MLITLETIKAEVVTNKTFETTIVSAFYIGPNKHGGTSKYLDWISNFMQFGFASIIYCDANSRELLSSRWPENDNRKYIEKPIEKFVTSAFDWQRDFSIDNEIAVGHSPHLYKIWGEKIFFTSEVALINPFKSNAFIWVDIGFFRNREMVQLCKGFPNPNRFQLDRITFLQIYPFANKEKASLYPVDERFRNVTRVGASSFAGGKISLLRFRELYFSILLEAKRLGVFSGKDQNLQAFLILRHPELFSTVAAIYTGVVDPWFSFGLIWSNKTQFLPRYVDQSFDAVFINAMKKDEKPYQHFYKNLVFV